MAVSSRNRKSHIGMWLGVTFFVLVLTGMFAALYLAAGGAL